MIITLLRKPLEGSVAENTLKHGCGAINIDDTRIGSIIQDTSKNARSSDRHKSTIYKSGLKEEFEGVITTGRWPANFIFVGDDSVKELDRQSGNRKTTWVSTSHKNNRQGDFLSALGHPKNQGYNDDGGASRFFKQFKKEDDQ